MIIFYYCLNNLIYYITTCYYQIYIPRFFSYPCCPPQVIKDVFFPCSLNIPFLVIFGLFLILLHVKSIIQYSCFLLFFKNKNYSLFFRSSLFSLFFFALYSLINTKEDHYSFIIKPHLNPHLYTYTDSQYFFFAL